MDLPGLSLFQGAESIKVNTSQQRIEEEDQLQDQIRRNEELKNELENAFDDLDCDSDDNDESHITNSTTSKSPNQFPFANNTNNNNNNHLKPLQNGFDFTKHPKHPPPPYNNRHNIHLQTAVGNALPQQTADTEKLQKELSQLKNALASKAEELKNVTAHASAERQKFQTQIDELKKRLSITEAEKERAHMTRKQTHELVVESKQKISEQDEHIAELNAKIKSLENKNLELITELEHTKTLLSETQHKYHLVERNANLSSDRHTDGIVKQLKDRHAAEVDVMQQQISTMRSKVEDRDNELKRLVIQNTELHKSREAILIDKADTINQLTQKLEASQRQCQDLLLKNSAGSDILQENSRLSRSVTALEQQVEDMQRTINNLTTRLETTTAELELMTDSAICEDTASSGSPSGRQIEQTPMLSKHKGNLKPKYSAVSSTPLVVEDRLLRLKQEFNRCLADQREKRQEIIRLKEQISSQAEEIRGLKLEENRALVEVNTSKENAERLMNRLKMTEMELTRLRESNRGSADGHTKSMEMERIEQQLNQLQKENESFRQNCDHLNEIIRELEDERDKIDEKYHNVCCENEKLLKKVQSTQVCEQCLNYEKDKFLLKDAREECLRLKNLYIQVASDKDELARKLADLETIDANRELNEQKLKVSKLERDLQIAEMKCTELSKMLDKEKVDCEQRIQEIKARYEQGKRSLSAKEKKNSENICTKCIDLNTKIAQFDIQNLQLQTNCSNYLKEIHDLKKSLKQSNHTISELEKQMTIKQEHDHLLNELKQKAKQFEEFMRNQTPTDHLLGKNFAVRDQCVSTDDLQSNEPVPRSASSNSTDSSDRLSEKRIREEMARSMALKLKAAENYFREQRSDYEEKINNLTVDLEKMGKTVDARNNELSVLKHCILSERTIAKKLMDKKERDLQEAVIRQNELLIRNRAELKAANERVEFLTKELDQYSKQFSAERESMEKLLEQWKTELAAFALREDKLNDQIRKMREEHTTEIQNLNEKYFAAKKTAANYKKYSEDKEKHIERESERIKKAYEAAVKKAKENAEAIVRENERKTNRRIAEITQKYDANIQQQFGT